MRNGGKIKVLTITTSGLVRREGISSVILGYYSKLNIERFELHIIASGEYDVNLVNDFKKLGVIVHFLPSRKTSPAQYFRAFIKLLKLEKFEVLYAHGSSAIISIELLIAKWFGCRNRIVHSHNTSCDHIIIDRILRPILYHVTTNRVACGEAAGKWLFGTKSFTILNNGRDPTAYQFDPHVRNQMRLSLGLSDKRIVIGHVGVFNVQKNHDFLIEVFKRFHDNNENSLLFLMGDGTKREEIENKAKEYGLSKSVVFTGVIANIPEMLQAMDIMVLPSIHEGLPLVVIEWQMAGLPCIISDTVTKECIFSELVTVLSLKDSADKWADTITQIKCVNRDLESKEAIIKSKKAGFDINEGVAVLDTILSAGGRACLPTKELDSEH